MGETHNNSNTGDSEGPQLHIYQLRGFWPAVIFGLTLATHGFYVYETAGHPFFNYPLVDSGAYDEQAFDVLAHGWVGEKIFWQAPLYPYFLAFCYQFIDQSYRFFDIRVIQAVLAAVNAVLLYAIARRRIGRGVAVGAAAAVAFYGPLIYFDTEMLAPVLVVFFYLLMALALDLALVFDPTSRLGPLASDLSPPASRLQPPTSHVPPLPWWLVAGALNGLAALAHGLALVIAPVVCVYALLGRSLRGWPVRRRVMAVALFAVGAAVVILPVTVRNRLVGGEWVLVSHNGPINFYIGNHPEYDKMVGLRPGVEWASLARELDYRGIETVGGEARHFIGAALANIRDNPLAVGRVWLKKIRLFFQADEIKRNYPIYPVREYSNLMWALMWKWPGLKFQVSGFEFWFLGFGFPFGVLLPLAVAGWWTLRRRGVRLIAVELILVGHFAANLLFFICSRYRVPASPFLVLYAAAAVHWAIGERLWQARSLRGHWRLVVVTLLVFLVSNAGLTPMDNAADRGEYQLYLGLVAHKHKKEFEKALEHYQAALRDVPDLTEAHSLLGILYQDHLGEPARALEQFDWVLDRDPDNMPVLYNRALALGSLGRIEQAREIMETLVEANPENRQYKRYLDQLSEKATVPESGNRTQVEDKATSAVTETVPPGP